MDAAKQLFSRAGSKLQNMDEARLLWLDAIITSFKHSPHAACIVTDEGYFLDVNHAWCHMLGYTERELREMRWQDVTHPDDIDEDQGNVDRVLGNEMPGYGMEKRYIRKDGSLIKIRLKVVGNHTDGLFSLFSSFAEPI